MSNLGRSLLFSTGILTGVVGAEPSPVGDMALLLYLADMVEVEGQLTDPMALAEWETNTAQRPPNESTEANVNTAHGENTELEMPAMRETRNHP